MSKIDKIGTVEYLSVRSHANRYYLPLKSDLLIAASNSVTIAGAL